MLGKTEAGREFQFLEVTGTNVLANEEVRHFSNLAAKQYWESAKRVLRAKHALGGNTDFNYLVTIPRRVSEVHATIWSLS